MLIRLFFQWLHRRAITTLRSSVDTLLKREQENPDEFENCGIVLPVVLAGLREKSKRPTDVILSPYDLTFRQREDIIRHINVEAARMNELFQQDNSDDAAYYSLVCLNWLEILQQAHFRSADMPDVLPEETKQTRDDISDFVFRALETGSAKLTALNAAEHEGQLIH